MLLIWCLVGLLLLGMLAAAFFVHANIAAMRAIGGTFGFMCLVIICYAGVAYNATVANTVDAMFVVAVLTLVFSIALYACDQLGKVCERRWAKYAVWHQRLINHQVADMVLPVNGPVLRSTGPNHSPTLPSDVLVRTAPCEVISFNDSITTESAERFISDCTRAENSPLDEVRIMVKSPGGEHDSTQLMMYAIRQLSLKKRVTMYAVGQCASGGVTLLLAVPISQRFSYNFVTFMIHRASSSEKRFGTQLINEKLIDEIISGTQIGRVLPGYDVRSVSPI